MHRSTLDSSSQSSFSSIRDEFGRSVVRVHDQLAVALCSLEQGKDLLQWRIKNAHFIPGSRMHDDMDSNTKGLNVSDDDVFSPPGLRIIHGFCEDLWQSTAYKEGKTMVVCTGCLLYTSPSPRD